MNKKSFFLLFALCSLLLAFLPRRSNQRNPKDRLPGGESLHPANPDPTTMRFARASKISAN